MTPCRTCGEPKPAEAFRKGRKTCKACEAAAARRRRDPGPTRTCSVCGEIKPLTEFAKDSRRADGTTGKCKACDAERHRSTPQPAEQPDRPAPRHQLELAPQVLAETLALRADADMHGTDVGWLKLAHHTAVRCDTAGPARVTPDLQRLSTDASAWHRAHADLWRPAEADSDGDQALLERLVSETVPRLAAYLADLAVLVPAWRPAIAAAPPAVVPQVRGLDAEPDAEPDAAPPPPPDRVEIAPTFVDAAMRTIAACNALDYAPVDRLATTRLLQAAEVCDQHRDRATHHQLRAFGRALAAYLQPHAPPVVQREGGEQFVAALAAAGDALWPAVMHRARLLCEARPPADVDLVELDPADYAADDYQATLLTCPPLAATAPNPQAAGSRLPHIALLAAWKGAPLMPHQCWLVHTATQRRSDGRWWHDSGNVTMARQTGKTEIILELGLDQMMLDTGGSPQAGPRRRMVVSSNNLIDAGTKLNEEQVPQLQLAGMLDTADLVHRRSPNNPSLTRDRPDGGLYRIIPANDDSGHGGTIHIGVIDEGHSYRDGAKQQALLYATRAVDGLYLLVGTKGKNDGSSGWYHANLDASRKALTEQPHVVVRYAGADRIYAVGQPGTMFHYEIAAPHGSDPADRACWGPASPSLGHTLRWDRLESEYARADAEGELPAFARGTLNLLVDDEDTTVVSKADWDAANDSTAEVDPSRPLVLGLAVAPVDRAHTYAVLSDGRTCEMARNEEGTEWCEAWIRQAVAANPNIAGVAAFAAGALSDTLTGLEEAGIHVEHHNMPRWNRACQAFSELLTARQLTIRHNEHIDEALRGAERKTAQSDTGYYFARRNRRDGDIGALQALIYAATAHGAAVNAQQRFSPRDHRRLRALYREIYGTDMPTRRQRRTSPDPDHEAQIAAAAAVFEDRYGHKPHASPPQDDPAAADD